MRLAALRCNIKNFKDYIILGDDVAIANKLVALEYTKIIKSIGMEISVPKSITPQMGFNSWEFASKLIVNGVNISPLPVGLLLLDDFTRFLEFCKELIITITQLQVKRPFDCLLEVIAPNLSENLEMSGLFMKKTLKTENFKGLTLINFITIFGIFLGLDYFRSNYTLDKGTGQYLYSKHLDLHQDSLSLNTDLDLFLHSMGLHY